MESRDERAVETAQWRMEKKGNHFKGFLNGIASSAAWECIKGNLWNPTMTASVVALWGRFHHGSLDWFAIGGMFVLTFGLTVWAHRKPTPVSGDGLVPSNNGPLTPLQIETFQLAKELVVLSQRATGSTFAEYFTNRIFPDPKDNGALHAIVSTYALDFAPRVRTVALKFGKEKIINTGLEPYFSSIPNPNHLNEIQGKLVMLMCRVDGIHIEVKNPE